jgi:hypothetical protein
MRAVTGARDEQLPHSAGTEGAHLVALTVPVVEVADDPNPAGVRRPHGERNAGHVAGRANVRAENVPQSLVAALADQMEIDLTEE